MNTLKRRLWVAGTVLCVAGAVLSAASVCRAQVATVRLGRGAPGTGAKATVAASAGGQAEEWLSFDLSPLTQRAAPGRDLKVYRADLVVFRAKEIAGNDDQRLVNIEICPTFGDAKQAGAAANTAAADGKPKPLELRAPWFDRFDATGAVRAWTAGELAAAGKPAGHFLVKAFPLWDKRTCYLDVAFEGQPANVPPQAQGLKVLHRAGQTFITWKAVADPATKDEVRWGEMKALLNGLDKDREVRYCIYRSAKPIDAATLAAAELIAQVKPLSCWNVNARNDARPRDEVIAALVASKGEPQFWVEGMSGSADECPIDRFVIPAGLRDLPEATCMLPEGSGLYVHTATDKANVYYAVVTMIDGVQNTVEFGKGNALAEPVAEAPADPAPVLQAVMPKRPLFDYRHTRHQFVQWTAPPYGNLPCQYFNWLVCVPDAAAKTYPLELDLPEPGNPPYRIPYRIEQDSIVVVPHDFPLDTWYYGYHESEGTLKSFRQGTIHSYTQKRILSFIDWVARAWPVDRNRISVAGNGLVAGSGALDLGLRHYKVFNLVMSANGCVDFCGAILKFRELGDVRKVPNIERTFKVTCREAAIERLIGKLDWDRKTDTGASVWDELNLTKLVRDLPAATDLPVVTYAGGGGFEPDRDFRLAMLDKGHLLIANYNVYGSRFIIPVSLTGSLTGQMQVDVRKNLSHPAFRGPGSEVLLKPPVIATGELVVSDGTLQWWGGFNEAYRWSGVLDEPARYEITLEWRSRGTGTTDVVLRRLQKFRVEAGKSYAWQFKTPPPPAERPNDRQVVQDGEVTPDADGLLRIPQLQIIGQPGRLVVTTK